MKVVTHIYAIIICFMLSLVVIALLVIALPFAIITELITFIREAISGDKFEHGIWIAQCRKSFRFIKRFYNILIDKPYNSYKE